MEQPLWETVWWFLRKLNMESPSDPGNPFLSLNTAQPSRDSHLPAHVHGSVGHNSQEVEPKGGPPTHEQTLHCVTALYLHAEEYHSTLPLVTMGVKLGDILLSEL